MFIREEFDKEKDSLIRNLGKNADLKNQALDFVNVSNKVKYAYVWNWLGLPIIQMPEDVVKVQEIIFESKPDFIVETGVAWGGSILLSASILKIVNPSGRVIGIDVTIPSHNAEKILNSPLSEMIELIEGSSVDNEVVSKVKNMVGSNSKVLLILDSHHTEDHVLQELDLWSELIQKDNYIIVCDTIVEFIEAPVDRPRSWSKGNNPLTGLSKFLKKNKRFELSKTYNDKALITFHPNGVLKAIS